jgi:hypothetical protein
MMLPTWLIEAGVHGAEIDPLLAEIRRQGMVGELLPHAALKKGSTPVVAGTSLGPGACVIGCGTFPFARQIQLHHRWAPGAWCTQENLDCAAYFAYFGKFLLNQHYAILTGVEAIRQADWVFSILGDEDEVFVRPTGCQKLFVGRRVSRDDFRNALSPARYDPLTQVVMAATMEIDREWRLVVIGDRIIAGSQYAQDGQRSVAPGVPADVEAFAKDMLAQVRWRPDPVFMLDICESGGQLWLVELNGFSCFWIYDADLPAVVEEVSAPRLVNGTNAVAWSRTTLIPRLCARSRRPPCADALSRPGRVLGAQTRRPSVINRQVVAERIVRDAQRLLQVQLQIRIPLSQWDRHPRQGVGQPQRPDVRERPVLGPTQEHKVWHARQWVAHGQTPAPPQQVNFQQMGRAEQQPAPLAKVFAARAALVRRRKHLDRRHKPAVLDVPDFHRHVRHPARHHRRHAQRRGGKRGSPGRRRLRFHHL